MTCIDKANTKLSLKGCRSVKVPGAKTRPGEESLFSNPNFVMARCYQYLHGDDYSRTMNLDVIVLVFKLKGVQKYNLFSSSQKQKVFYGFHLFYNGKNWKKKIAQCLVGFSLTSYVIYY